MSELPNGWALAPFEALFDRLQYGLTAKASADASGTRFLRITDIQDGQVNWETVPGLSSQADIERYILSDGDFVFARSGSVEKAARLKAPPESVFASYLIRGRPMEPALGDWLAYFVSSSDYLDQIAARAAGIGMSNVSAEKLKSVALALPPLAEQQRIVAKLDILAARTARARADLDRIPALAARYKLAVLAKAFSGELTAEWRAENDVDEAQVLSLQDLCETITDGDHQAPPKADSGVPFITIGAMNDGRLDLTRAVRFVPRGYFQALKPSRVARRGDVLYSVTGSFGIPALVDTDDEFVFQRHIAILKPLQARVSGHFLSLMLGAPQVLEQATAVATGTAQLTVPLTGLRQFQLSAPSLREQDEILRAVSNALAEIDRVTAEAAAARRLLDRLYQAVLAKAFRGELVLQDPTDEPASSLLNRIRAERASAPKAERGRRSSKPAVSKRSSMPKSRLDEDVNGRPFLASILRDTGLTLSAVELFKASDLPITDFYKQLAWELDQGLVKEDGKQLEAA
ncbi:restriction endonuclease subunit S [Brevundimonas sp.]|uniref:restriction endonuclease subunit S n=1 Tax=Brevundimonas sp. TaxID=1871086 RepID=UPI00121C02B7|nr:restriction endonuclease subunit S [Brevundimonas sp.]TAJ64228.1 MAG: hypothetical protein EPO49_05250 [Brevundimonas sp.]